MANIAPHNRPGAWRNLDYSIACPWPDDCYVQWGTKGIVGLVGKPDGVYSVPGFFEAFPSGGDSGSFIRGEGLTIEEAERNAFAKFERHRECPHNQWRRMYPDTPHNKATNCTKCRAFRTDKVPSVYDLNWRRPLTQSEARMIDLEEDDYEPTTREWAILRRRLILRRKFFGGAEPWPNQ